MTTVYSYGAGSPRAVTRDTNAPRAHIHAVDALRVHHVGRGTTVEKTRERGGGDPLLPWGTDVTDDRSKVWSKNGRGQEEGLEILERLEKSRKGKFFSRHTCASKLTNTIKMIVLLMRQLLNVESRSNFSRRGSELRSNRRHLRGVLPCECRPVALCKIIKYILIDHSRRARRKFGLYRNVVTCERTVRYQSYPTTLAFTF